MLTAEQNAHLEAARLSCTVGHPQGPYRVIGELCIWVYAMAYGNGRLCVGHKDDRTGYDRGFCYQGIDKAFAAADEWDGEGDPPRWFKNLQTHRYRKDGDPAKEYGPEDRIPE